MPLPDPFPWLRAGLPSARSSSYLLRPASVARWAHRRVRVLPPLCRKLRSRCRRQRQLPHRSSAAEEVCFPAEASDEMAWVRSPFLRNSLIAVFAIAGTGAWLSLDNFAQTHGFLINRTPSLPN